MLYPGWRSRHQLETAILIYNDNDDTDHEDVHDDDDNDGDHDYDSKCNIMNMIYDCIGEQLTTYITWLINRWMCQ